MNRHCVTDRDRPVSRCSVKVVLNLKWYLSLGLGHPVLVPLRLWNRRIRLSQTPMRSHDVICGNSFVSNVRSLFAKRAVHEVCVNHQPTSCVRGGLALRPYRVSVCAAACSETRRDDEPSFAFEGLVVSRVPPEQYQPRSRPRYDRLSLPRTQARALCNSSL